MDERIRLATLDDSDEILAIYTPYVKDTHISFEYDVPSQQAFRERMHGIMCDYPLIVCEGQGGIAGFAYASRHKERASYDWVINLSVYLDDEQTSRGLGSRMYSCLAKLLKLQNVQNMYGYVDAGNMRSRQFHLKHGFEQLAIYKKVGYKLGEWLDVVAFVKFIGEHENPPAPFIAFPDVDGDMVSAILAQA